jgi:uncharacterized protein (TIGR02117 family)
MVRPQQALPFGKEIDKNHINYLKTNNKIHNKSLSRPLTAPVGQGNILKILRFILFIYFVSLITSCSGRPYAIKPVQEPEHIRSKRIYIVNHGWHTGLIVSGEDVNEAVPELSTRFGHPNYYEIGWGDKGFYQAQEITSGLTLQAMFWSEGAILHVVAFSQNPTEYFSGEPIISTCLSENEIASLKLYIASSFNYSPSDSIITLRSGIYGNSQFYDGVGRYYIMNTCNKWTAKALESAGLEIQPFLKLTANSVMDELEKVHHICKGK